MYQCLCACMIPHYRQYCSNLPQGQAILKFHLKWNADESKFQYTVGQNVVSHLYPNFYMLGDINAIHLPKFLE